MDQHFQIGIALDRIRETQWHQNALLDAIARNQLQSQELLTQLLNMKTNGSTYMGRPEPKRSSTFLKTLANNGVQTGVQWLAGLLAMAYIAKGGDALTLLQTVLKAF